MLSNIMTGCMPRIAVHVAVGVVTILLVVLVFAPCFSGEWEFVWDDTANYSEDMKLRLRWSWENARWWSRSTVLRVYEPVGLALKAAVGAFVDNPGSEEFHRVAVASHACCAGLAAIGSVAVLDTLDCIGAVRESSGVPQTGVVGRQGLRFVCALIGASVFGIHPLTVQVVCWVSCLPYIWAGIFGWLASILWLKTITVSGILRRFAISATVASLYVAGTFCKAAVLPLPCLFVLVRSLRRDRWSLYLNDIPVFVVAFWSTWLATQSIGDERADDVQAPPSVPLCLSENLLRVSLSVLHYIRRFVWVGVDAAPFAPVEHTPFTFPERVTGLAAFFVVMVLSVVSFVAVLLPIRSLLSIRRGSTAWLSYLLLFAPCSQLFVVHGDVVWCGGPIVTFI